MKLIPLTHGKFATVDDSDYKELSKHKWLAQKDGNTYYALRAVTVSPGKQKLVRMHRVLLGVTRLEKLDHWDGDGLNNRRYNLRLASTRQNGQNRKKVSKASSPFKGVCFHKRDLKWQARIKHPGVRSQLGYFNTELEAAAAYNIAAKKLFGTFARLNTLPE